MRSIIVQHKMNIKSELLHIRRSAAYAQLELFGSPEVLKKLESVIESHRTEKTEETFKEMHKAMRRDLDLYQ